MVLGPTAFQIMMKCKNDTGAGEVFDNENEVNYVNVAENENDKSECWNAAGSQLEIKQHSAPWWKAISGHVMMLPKFKFKYSTLGDNMLH